MEKCLIFYSLVGLLFCVFKEFRKPPTLLFVFLFLVPWWWNRVLSLSSLLEKEKSAQIASRGAWLVPSPVLSTLAALLLDHTHLFKKSSVVASP